MKKESLRDRIIRYFRNHPEMVNGGEIERLAMEKGYKASNASRRLRELQEEGILARREIKNPKTKIKSVWYKFNNNFN